MQSWISFSVTLLARGILRPYSKTWVSGTEFERNVYAEGRT